MEGNKNKFGRGEFFFLLDVPVRERDHRRIVFIRTHILRNVLTGVTVNREFIFVARAKPAPTSSSTSTRCSL
jgi:hypothetical protein